MAKIANDIEMRDALRGLDLSTQRIIGARFAFEVREYVQNKNLLRLIETGMESDLSDSALDATYQAAKALSVATYTACGRDADWIAQAEHFVAEAITAALAPDPGNGDVNPAWKAAMQARIARTCAMIDNANGKVHDEAVAQYQIVETALD